MTDKGSFTGRTASVTTAWQCKTSEKDKVNEAIVWASQQPDLHCPFRVSCPLVMTSIIPCNRHKLIRDTDLAANTKFHSAFYHLCHLTDVAHRAICVVKELFIKWWTHLLLPPLLKSSEQQEQPENFWWTPAKCSTQDTDNSKSQVNFTLPIHVFRS